ncbi:MAG: DDE-type integrase/transposase/recombinase [Flavobacteriales bacterium]|nr:DDE-type integrase/transposase/recombinase [Flavobacteriales bacterium]
MQIEAPGHVWSTDITYIAMGKGFLYLTAVMDWHSRYVLSWQISNTLDTSFCLEALHGALLQYPSLLAEYFAYYNHQRPHQHLDGLTPAHLYFGLPDTRNRTLTPTLLNPNSH